MNGFDTIIGRAATLVLIAAALLAGCTSQDIASRGAIEPGSRVALMPIVNYSQAPQAGEAAESMVTSLWLSETGRSLLVYERPPGSELPPIDDGERFERARDWLATQDVDYYLTGSVQEWRYKTGLDGEPAVGVTLRLHDTDGRLVWSAQGSRAGWDRESLASTAQKLLREQIRALDRAGE